MSRLAALLVLGALAPSARAADPPPPIADVEGQPLAANAERLGKALQFLGAPLAPAVAKQLDAAVTARDAVAVQKALDPHVLFVVNLNPEARVKVARGPAAASLQQAGWTPVLVKVVNDSTVTKKLAPTSPQAGPVYSGQGRQERDPKADPNIVKRFLELELFTAPPMMANLSGLRVEYAILLVYSTEAGKREATVGFDIGQGNQDLGFRGEVPVLFDVKPAVRVRLGVKDFDGTPTVGRFTFTDAGGRVYPPQPKRLAPDLFFQKQVYRADGGFVLLPPGEFTVEYGRGPEYALKTAKLKIEAGRDNTFEVKLERWINPATLGWYSGDHHIHAAGCAHYTNPAEGVLPEDMFVHVKGEGLNVGCCLTWGPCYDYQRQFFEVGPHRLSEPFTVIKYDVEVSGFGSQALGHVNLLNLKDQTYTGSGGSKLRGWPTWTTPLMRWAKAQGAVTGYAHSANGLGIDAPAATRRLFVELDKGTRGFITKEQAAAGRWPLPEAFAKVDADGDGKVTEVELAQSTQRTKGNLPNLVIPEMNGIGAQEICVTSALGLCDFISAMDTARVPEWNCWYHIMNCGFPLKVSGETDFPCITGSRVGQGRVYVQLGKVDHVDYGQWCRGLRDGKSYVSDGYAHALAFGVNGVSPGPEPVKLAAPGKVGVKATVAFAGEMPLGTSVGGAAPAGPTRTVELVMNGQVVATKEVPADGKPHDVAFDVDVAASSWVALRQFPQLHTNPVTVLVGDKPIRASRASAKWCVGTIERLWSVRGQGIAAAEREEAERTFREAVATYLRIADEAPEG
ncbi:MAG TPA: CehA/McbA family metallohydrolase, partial [Urbifossiella sp.]|nr:CehA/McbA family metallohydrolase [Urbifossiella sp.]